MRPYRQHKPDTLLFLFVLVTLGMLITSVAQAENYLFGQRAEILFNSGHDNSFNSSLLPSSRHNWLQVPGATSVKTLFKGGMAHFLYEDNIDNKVESILPDNTRLIFSLGVERNARILFDFSSRSARRDAYSPTLYFTLGHRW